MTWIPASTIWNRSFSAFSTLNSRARCGILVMPLTCIRWGGLLHRWIAEKRKEFSSKAGFPYGCFKQELKNFVPRSYSCMEGIRPLSYYFPQGPERHQLHIIVQPPPPIYCWRFGDKFSQYFKIHIDYRKCPPSRLKEAIHRKMRLYSIDAAEIELFKVKECFKKGLTYACSTNFLDTHSLERMERRTRGAQVEQ